MPIYVWKCRPCNCLFERIVSNWADAMKAKLLCEVCGSEMDRQLTAASPQFKGAGWATDGYSKDKP